MFIDGDHHFIHAHIEFFRSGLQNANIGLMRHQPINIGLLHIICRQRFIDNLVQRIHRHFKHGIAFHVYGVVAIRFVRHMQHFLVISVCVNVRRDNALLLRGA